MNNALQTIQLMIQACEKLRGIKFKNPAALAHVAHALDEMKWELEDSVFTPQQRDHIEREISKQFNKHLKEFHG